MTSLTDGASPTVSIVIPILNESRTIDATLDSVLTQTFTDFELLAVDGMSDDGTLGILEARAAADVRVRVLSNPRRSIPAALNIGLEAARGEYLVRVDAHSTIPSDYVDRLVALLRDGPWAGVGGRKNALGEPPNGAVIAAALGSFFGVGGSAYHHAQQAQETDHVPFGVYRTVVARQIGGWDERLLANEDYEFDVRIRAAGGRLLLDPSIEIRWRCRSRFVDLARQYRRYGRGKADVAFLHPSEIRLRHAAPPAAVVGLILGAVTSIWRPRLGSAVVGGYGLAVFALSVPIARTLDSWRDRIRVPLALVSMQLPWGWGMWEGLARIAGNGFRLPDSGSRWGSPKWDVGTTWSD